MPTVSENHDESQKSIGRLMGQMEIVLRAIQDHHSEAQNSRQRMFIKLDEQAATQAAQAERLALLEQEVRPMKDAVEDYRRFRSNAKGFIGAATFFVAIIGAALSHLIAAGWQYLKHVAAGQP